MLLSFCSLLPSVSVSRHQRQVHLLEAMVSRVYIVESDASLRMFLTTLLATEGYEVEEFVNADSFLASSASLHDAVSPHCLVTDVTLPDITGIDLQKELVHLQVQIPVILLSRTSEFSMAVEAMRCGAVDFLTTPVKSSTLLRSISRALTIDESRCVTRARQIDYQLRLRSLSAREREVLNLTATGKFAKEIAAILGITVSTVLKHKAHMLAKMGVRNDVEVALLMSSISHLAIDTNGESVECTFEGLDE